jgi:hypothetical protein
MERKEGVTYRKTAGLDLIREIRDRGIDVPIYIYASRQAVQEHSDKIRELGGNGITASPLDLFGLVERSIV